MICYLAVCHKIGNGKVVVPSSSLAVYTVDKVLVCLALFLLLVLLVLLVI
jgi:hypothetical protein